jgi:exosome complex RNA-binding protein Csl4
MDSIYCKKCACKMKYNLERILECPSCGWTEQQDIEQQQDMASGAVVKDYKDEEEGEE